MRFNFTGEVRYNDISSNYPYRREIKTKNGDDGLSVNFFVNSAKNNSANVEVVGFHQDVIKTSDVNNNKIEINWDDRQDKDVIENVASYRKYSIRFGKDREEYIAAKDFVDWLDEHIDEIKGKRVTITGQVQKNIYKGKFSDRFQMQRISDPSEKAKDSLHITTIFFWNKEGIDTADFKTDKKIRIDGYTNEYIADEKENKYVPLQVVLNCAKINFDDEKHVAQLNVKLHQLGLNYKDGKIENKLKAKAYASNEIVLSYVNGAEEIEFDESQLTDVQREMIEVGLKTIEDFRPRGQIYGERRTEYRIVDFPCISGTDFENGMIYLDEKPSEFEDQIYTIPEDESLDDIEKDDEEEDLGINEPEEEESEDEDLFD